MEQRCQAGDCAREPDGVSLHCNEDCDKGMLRRDDYIRSRLKVELPAGLTEESRRVYNAEWTKYAHFAASKVGYVPGRHEPWDVHACAVGVHLDAITNM